MNELKPCPFCGSRAEINHKEKLDAWIVECTNQRCFASYMIGWWYDTEQEAVEMWNRRETQWEN